MSTTRRTSKQREASCDLQPAQKIDQRIPTTVTGAAQKKPPLPITADGIWMDRRMAPLARPRAALFLDRDGVIVRDTGFLSNPDNVTIIPEIAALMRHANQSGVPVLVVTNQSGIDRGLFDWSDFAAIEQSIASKLAALGARSDATAACPFHPDYTDDYNDDHAQWRKPGSGLIKAVAGALGIAISASWLVGDRPSDMEAARDAGLAGGVLIGHRAPEAVGNGLGRLTQSVFAMQVAESAGQAAEQILATDLFDEK